MPGLGQKLQKKRCYSLQLRPLEKKICKWRFVLDLKKSWVNSLFGNMVELIKTLSIAKITPWASPGCLEAKSCWRLSCLIKTYRRSSCIRKC